MRGFLSSSLEVVNKGLKPTRNRSVGHGLGSAEQSFVTQHLKHRASEIPGPVNSLNLAQCGRQSFKVAADILNQDAMVVVSYGEHVF
jgi:hypothetical protein